MNAALNLRFPYAMEFDKACMYLRWAGYVARMEEGRRAFKFLTGRLHLGRRWEDDIIMDLKEKCQYEELD